MVTFHMLLTSDLPSLPTTVKIVQDWGEISVFFPTDKKHCHGRHVQVEGALEEVDKWLSGGAVIVGDGPPICQSFMIWEYRKGGMLFSRSLSS